MSSRSPEPPLPADFLRLPLAHRGLHDRKAGRIENSRAAVRAAVAAGYGIEIDIQPSRDHVPMVFHDYELGRLTAAQGRITDHRAAALAEIPLASGEGIPTLAEILGIVGGAVPLLIEIKDQDGALGRDVGRLERAVADALAGYDGPVAVMSFNPHSVAAMRDAAPGIARGLVTEAFASRHWQAVPAARRAALAGIAGFETSGAAFISCGHRDLDRPPVHALKARGVPVLCWTIRSAAEEAAARKIADNITFEGYLPPLGG